MKFYYYCCIITVEIVFLQFIGGIMETLRLFIISDSTGETGEQIVKASIAQFTIKDFKIKRFSHVRDINKLHNILEECSESPYSIIFYSLVNEILIDYTRKYCDLNSITSVDILSPSIIAIERMTDQNPTVNPGALRKLDEQYFKRVEAIEFAVRYDDGKDPRGVLIADITILGISRTSKTPLSMYLANKNIRVCNIPLVPETPVPDELFQIPAKKVIGLTNSPEKLNEIRKERLKAMGLPPISSYSDLGRILDEIEHAHRIMKRIGCPIIDVSARSIEETAEIIIKHMKKTNII